jgi:DNA-binding XRE family transcriptional regulator
MARNENTKITVIEQKRTALNMTQVQLAEYAGLSRMTILDLENRHNVNPQATTLMAIAKVLNVPFEDLYADLHNGGGEDTES